MEVFKREFFFVSLLLGLIFYRVTDLLRAFSSVLTIASAASDQYSRSSELSMCFSEIYMCFR